MCCRVIVLSYIINLVRSWVAKYIIIFLWKVLTLYLKRIPFLSTYKNKYFSFDWFKSRTEFSLWSGWTNSYFYTFFNTSWGCRPENIYLITTILEVFTVSIKRSLLINPKYNFGTIHDLKLIEWLLQCKIMTSTFSFNNFALKAKIIFLLSFNYSNNVSDSNISD